MTEDKALAIQKHNCKHERSQLYTQRRYDILNGMEFTFTRCINCHKIVKLEARKFSKH